MALFHLWRERPAIAAAYNAQSSRAPEPRTAPKRRPGAAEPGAA
jgi:hypothetical protein